MPKLSKQAAETKKQEFLAAVQSASDDREYTPAEIANGLGVTLRTIQNKIHDGEIKADKRSNMYYVPKPNLLAWLTGAEQVDLSLVQELADILASRGKSINDFLRFQITNLKQQAE